ncbi:MAG: DUF2637 domain-containing protein, partial [Trebonia sp.]
MRLKFPRVPLPSWRRRVRSSSPAPVVELGGTLRVFRAAALWGISVLILTAAGAAFAESYRGLLLWAEHHALAGVWAALFPLQVDLFVAVGELVLFVAMIDRWSWRDRAGAWAVALLGLAASIMGNVGHVAAHDLQSRGTAAVPPLAAFAALWLGLGVLKRVVRHRGDSAVTREPAAVMTTSEASSGPLAAALAELAAATRALAERPAEAATGTAQGALLAELMEAVRRLGAQVSDAVSSPVPVDAENAALIALRATIAAGNPLSGRQLETRFGLTRAQVARVRELAGD